MEKYKGMSSVFDIEANGLTPDKIHCLAVNTGGDKKSTVSYDNMIKFFTKADILIGHNIHRYDIPVVEKILKVKVKAKLVDTLALSWYLYPKRIRHGLADWGEEFGIPKPVIDDWDNLSPEEYLHRCQEDVAINTKLWNKMWSYLIRLYGSDEEAWRLIDYLCFKMDCARQQEAVGWKLDEGRCVGKLEELQRLEEERLESLAKVMPKVEIWKTKNKPKLMYLKSKVGVLSKRGEQWMEDIKEYKLPDNCTTFKFVDGYKDPNPGSMPQLKDWFYSLGWEPDEFKWKRDKDTGDVRTIPQINKQTPGEVGLCESVKLLYPQEPSLKLVDGLFVIRHRIGILKGFLADMDDEGYVRAQIQGLTNTLRFKHKVVLNLPGVDKPYGEDIRGCLIAPEGYELCGSDMSSLEDRCKQHYMWPHDPDYVTEMMRPGFDPHINLAQFAKAMTAADVERYASGDKGPYKAIRAVYKQGNYACVYGAQGPTVSRSTGLSLAKADKLVKDYWRRNWAVKAIAEECVVKKVGGQKWLYNPVSKLWYTLRHEKDRFSTLNQGTGVFCFDKWLGNVREGGPPIPGQMHDEWIGLIKKGKRDKMRKHVEEAIDKTNTQLGLNVKLGCDIQFGSNYAEIH